MQQRTCPLCGCHEHEAPALLDTVAYRFWSKVDVRADDQCWEWQGSRTAFGHGRFRYDGKSRGAHRMAWLLHTGELPDDQVVRHRCDNPPCVNPAHLVLGTHADNARDKVERGRQPPNTNSLKTHCKRNHPFTPENTRVNPTTGQRSCKECKRAWNREWWRRNTSLRAPVTTVTDPPRLGEG